MAAGETIERGKRALRRHGVGGLTRIVADAVRDRTYLVERHVWLELVLDGRPEARPLPEGLELISVTEAELPLAAAMGRGADRVRAWIAAGHELWLVREGQSAAFSCWVFHGRAPLIAARGGWMDLPGDVVCLEDSVTDANYRGRGIAPAAWGAIATALQERGVRTMITKVGVDNAPSLKACRKAGFVEIGLMWLRRIGPRYSVRVSDASGATGEFLARTLDR